MKTKITLLFLTFFLFACSQTFTIPETSSAQLPTETPILQTITGSVIASPTDEASTTSASQQDCTFTWAYHDLPELTAGFDASIKALNSNATAHATAFGEDCIGEGGIAVRFGAMETDFYVTLSVDDLNDYEFFGNWIAQVMDVVNMLPPDMLAGPNSGFVEFRFEKTQTDSIGFRVPISQYNTTTNGVTGEELLQMFYTAP